MLYETLASGPQIAPFEQISIVNIIGERFMYKTALRMHDLIAVVIPATDELERFRRRTQLISYCSSLADQFQRNMLTNHFLPQLQFSHLVS